MSKLRLLQVILVIGMFAGLIIDINGNSNGGAIVFGFSLIGLILVRLARFIWRD